MPIINERADCRTCKWFTTRCAFEWAYVIDLEKRGYRVIGRCYRPRDNYLDYFIVEHNYIQKDCKMREISMGMNKEIKCYDDLFKNLEWDAVKELAKKGSKEHWAVINDKIAIYRPILDDYILGTKLLIQLKEKI